ncbi:hypothetical Protein pso3_05450 [Candidatus Phytoplasma solani]
MPYIFQKYAKKEKVDLTLVEIDPDMVEILQIIYDKTSIPKNFNLKFICQDFLNLKHEKVDLIIDNPPFNKAKNKEQKIEIIVIDHLQITKSTNHLENDRLAIDEIMTKLKQLAIELNIVIIILSQFSRDTYNNY